MANETKAALKLAIEIAGGQSALGRYLGVRQSLVSYWLHSKGRPPPEHVIDIEKATQSQVTRYDLRPDIYPRAPL